MPISYPESFLHTKHTGGRIKDCGICKENNTKNCSRKCFDIEEFLVNGDKEYLFLKYEYPTTLEGQIVCIADEIAQRGHDLDDAFASRYLSFDDLFLYSEIRKMKPIREILEKIKSELDLGKDKNKIFIDENDMLKSRLVPEILGYLMEDLIIQSEYNINKFNSDNDLYKKHHRINEKLIQFSDEGIFIVNYLESLISKKVINSSEVARFDNRAKVITSELFKVYYNNPKLLPETTLRRIYRDIRKVSNNVIDFNNGDPKLISKEFNSICFAEPKTTCGLIYADDEYIKKRIIFVRNITDYIAGMTDSYAINEYNSIYGTL